MKYAIPQVVWQVTKRSKQSGVVSGNGYEICDEVSGTAGIGNEQATIRQVLQWKSERNE